MAYGQTGAGKTYTLSDKLSSGGGITAVGGYSSFDKDTIIIIIISSNDLHEFIDDALSV